MPITQQRVAALLDEALSAHDSALRLRADIYAVLAAQLTPTGKLDAIEHLLDHSSVPLTLTLCEQERSYIARTAERNRRAAARMQKSRQRQRTEQRI